MLAQDGFTPGVIARMQDFFGDRSPWQRRLWMVGTLLRLAEADEAVTLSGTATGLHEGSVKHALASARDLGRDDPGIGAPKERGHLAQLLTSTIEPGSEEQHRLQEIVDDARPRYLDRWLAAMDAGPPRVELTARLIASHLLDGGSSPGHLYRWLDNLQRDEDHTFTFREVLELAKEQEASREIEVLIPFVAIGQFPEMPRHWLGREELTNWMTEKLADAPGCVDDIAVAQLAGGIVVELTARDAGAAAAAAASMVEAYRARVGIGSREDAFVPASVAFVTGGRRPIALQPKRDVNIRALEREAQLFEPPRGATIDSALELVALLDRGSPAAAIAGGWAGVESLLKAPGDGGAHKVAPRLAALLACSYVRAELTTLAWRLIRMRGKNDDAKELARELRKLGDNRFRAPRVSEILLAGHSLGLTNPSDIAAEDRMRKLLQTPGKALADILRLLEDPLARFYRQRNLVLHGGHTQAVALEASLRTAAPLIGAAVDRIAHAWFVNDVEPLRLVAIARLRLDRLETPDAAPLTAMLEI